MPKLLDAIDRRILRALQADGRLPNTELAAQVGLSPSPCLRRVKMLEEGGTIQRYAALLSGAAVGLPMTIYPGPAQRDRTAAAFGLAAHRTGRAHPQVPHPARC